VPDSPWTIDNRDGMLRRISMLTAGTAAVGAVGAVGLGALFVTQTVPAKSTQPVVVKQAAPTSTGTARTTPAVALTPRQVQVRVLNGTGVAGAARAAASDLTAQGFTVVGLGNAPGGPVSATTISYSTAARGAATLLAGATGVSSLVPDGSGAVVVLTVGPDWSGSTPSPAQQASTNQSSSSSNNSNSSSNSSASNNNGPVVVSGGS